MGVIDRLAKRLGYSKAEPAKRVAVRRFDATKTDRMLYGWTTTPLHINADLRQSWGALVARARELAKNDDYVRRYMRVARNNILGASGIKLQAQIRGNDGKADQAANKAVEAAWDTWGRPGVCEASGRLSWCGVQNTVVDSITRDGEAIAILERNGNEFNFQIRLVDPCTMPWDYQMDSGRGQRPERQNRILMGVEYDRNDRAIAYHFNSDDPSVDGYYSVGARGFQRVAAAYQDGRPRVLHIFRMEEIGQKRGVSGLASAVLRLKMLSGYEEATLVAARAGASQMLFFRKGEGAEAEYTGDTTDTEGAPIDEIEPGIARALPDGWQIEPYEPPHPSTQYTDFTKQTLRGIAAGLGISYITLANDLESVNYSSARVGVLEDREEWRGVQKWIEESLCQPVYDSWLDFALLAKQIRINGQPVGLNRRDRFAQVSWMPRRWPWVDPLKDMQANQLAVGMRARSICDVIREQGKDPEEVFAEIQREREMLEELGISPDDMMEAIDDGQTEED